MSSSTGEAPALPVVPQLSGEGLAELLSVISEAPDFGSAASFLIAQLAEVAGARRAVLLTLDRANQSLQVSAALGFPSESRPVMTLPIEDQAHALVVAALSRNTR